MSANEIDKVSLASKNESLPVDQRITGVREWLRLSDYSARSCIIARRIAKKILRDYKANAATWEMSQKAERLLNFVEKGVKAKTVSPPEQQSATVTPSAPAGDTFIYDYKKVFWVTVGYEDVTAEEAVKIRDEVYSKCGTDRPLWTRENGKLERTEFGEQVYAEYMTAIAAAVAKKKAEAGNDLSPRIAATGETRTMGVLVEVVKAPDQLHRYLIAAGNTYGGPRDVKFVNVREASTEFRRGQWTGKMFVALAERIFNDFLNAANQGLEAGYFKSIRVTTYADHEENRQVIYPREAEAVHTEPEVLPVAQASDGAWRVVPTTGFKKGPRDWTFSFAFMDSNNEPRTGTFTGKTKQECVLKLFGAIMPAFVVEYVRTLPLAHPNDIPREPEPEKDYVPRQAEIDAVPAMTPSEWNSIPSAVATRRYALDWKFRISVDKLSAKEAAEIAKQNAEKAAAREKEELEARKKQYRDEDAKNKLKGDL